MDKNKKGAGSWDPPPPLGASSVMKCTIGVFLFKKNSKRSEAKNFYGIIKTQWFYYGTHPVTCAPCSLNYFLLLPGHFCILLLAPWLFWTPFSRLPKTPYGVSLMVMKVLNACACRLTLVYVILDSKSKSGRVNKTIHCLKGTIEPLFQHQNHTKHTSPYAE